MSIPDEYTIEEIIRKADDMIICRADHPIHGRVIIYKPDDTLPASAGSVLKRHLYQTGLRIRSISELNLPFVAKILEVSSNPNEPYIVIEYSKYDLEKIISDNIKLKPKKVYQIFSQVLQAVSSLTENGWQIDHLNPDQIRLSDVHTGDAIFSMIGSLDFQNIPTKTTTVSDEGGPTETIGLDEKKDSTSAGSLAITEAIDETQTLTNSRSTENAGPDIEPTVTESQKDDIMTSGEELRLIQRNIYLLGSIAYQLLFGVQYHLSDNDAVVNIKKLGAKWRIMLDKALTPNLEDRYNSYQEMLSDIQRVLSRNKKIAIGVAPVIVLLLIAGVSVGVNQYRRYKIMTSEAGQAIENFLNIINTTSSEFPEPYNPSIASGEPNDDTILKPFEQPISTSSIEN